MTSLFISDTEAVGGYVMSRMQASLAFLALSLASGCGSESGFKEGFEVVVDEKVAVKLETTDPQQSLHKLNEELLTLLSASCELPHRIQAAVTPSTNAAVTVIDSSASATREHGEVLPSRAASDESTNRLGLLSQKMTMSSASEEEVKSTLTSISAILLKPLTPEILRAQGVGFSGADDLNPHMAFYEYLRSNYGLQSEARVFYRKASMNATGNGSEELVFRVVISDDKLRCEKVISRNVPSR